MTIRTVLTRFPRALMLLPLYLVRALSYVVPRRRTLWVFDSWRGERFADNAKYFFLHVTESAPDIRAIWLTRSRTLVNDLRSRGYEVYHTHSLRGLYYTLRAKLLVSDSHPFATCYWVMGGMTTLNLWHGLSFKKVLYDSSNTKHHNWVYSSRGWRRFLHIFFEPHYVALGDYVLTTANFWVDKFASAFHVDPSHVIVAGYPRTDPLVNETRNSDIGTDTDALVRMRKFREEGEKCIMYMPTFRDGAKNPILQGGIDFDDLNAFFRDLRAHLFLKFHHEKKFEGAAYSNIHVIETASDPYPLVRETDLLITDYSSILFDFLFTDRPQIFFPFDLNEYTSQRRELYFPYDEVTPGLRAYSVDELKRHITTVLIQKDAYTEERAALFRRVFDPETRGRASAVLLEKLRKIVL